MLNFSHYKSYVLHRATKIPINILVARLGRAGGNFYPAKMHKYAYIHLKELQCVTLILS